MIKPSDLEDLTNVSNVDKIYEELMSNGLEAIRATSREAQSKIFSKICHNLIQQYVEWNDYVHSNNIMQLYRDTVLLSEQVKKPSWFIRYEIIIYGRRTPLYFIDNPQKLFNRLNIVLSREKETQTIKIIGAVVSLFNYYGVNFLSLKTSPDDKKIFIKEINEIFAKEYKRTDQSLFPIEIKKSIGDFIDYAENPSAYIVPGVPADICELWDEDEEPDEISKNAESLEDEENTGNRFKYLENKTIKFIGAIKNSLVEKIKHWGKEYNFEAGITAGYDKIKNLDFRKFRYTNKYAAVIAGPMPHSVKGKGDYSSGLEMIKNEPGYPDVVECITNDKLKITGTSLWKALQEVNYKLMEK